MICEPPARAPSIPVSGPRSRLLAEGSGWSVGEFICNAGPADRPFEEQHDKVSVAVVLEGSFNYVSDTGRALLHPGALLLGNAQACYQCGHSHSTGDRCLSARFEPEHFAEIAASEAGSSTFRFPVPMLPSSQNVLPVSVLLEASCRGSDPLKTEESVMRFLATALRNLSGSGATGQRVSAHDERRVSRILRYMETRAEQPLDLARLAGVAAMSKYHFLRVFRRTTGLTPYQYLLGLRLRRAALRLLASPDPVSRIAFESGSGDLSTFNQTFCHPFGMSPTAFRRKESAY